MRRINFATVFAMFAVLILFGGIFFLACNDDSDTGFDDDDDDQQPDDDDDDDDSNIDDIPPDPPLVDPVVSPTPLAFQSIRGTAERDAVITVIGGAEPASTKAGPIVGSWCVLVNLLTNQINDLEVTATDAWFNISDPTEVEIEQDESLWPEVRNGSPSGYAEAASSSTTTCPDCTPDKVIDENLDTLWMNSTSPLNPESGREPQWIAVDLGEQYQVENVTIRWGQYYGIRYSVWYSILPSPRRPHVDPYMTQWNFIYEENGGVGGVDVITPTTEVEGRWFVILLNESNYMQIPWMKYYFSVVEFEINGIPVSEIPTDNGC